MATNKPSTVAEYLRQLPDDRRKAIESIRRTIRRNLPKGYAEGMQYGMIGWFVPHSRYPAGYHCDPREPVPFAGLGNWKGHIGIYLFCTYVDPAHHEWFRDAWAATGKRLDMGKGCVRVKRLEDVPLEVLGEAVAKVPVDAFLRHYESIVPASSRRPGRKAKTSSKKTAVTRKVASAKSTAKAASPKTRGSSKVRTPHDTAADSPKSQQSSRRSSKKSSVTASNTRSQPRR